MEIRNNPTVRMGGFTMLEIMIVVAIVGILAAIALPSYTDHVRRGNLVDAVAQLSDTRVKLEQYFQDNRTYQDTGTKVSPCPADTQYFTFACNPDTATTFTITASGIAGTNVADFEFTIDESNAKTTTSLPASWGGTLPAACWILKKGDTC